MKDRLLFRGDCSETLDIQRHSLGLFGQVLPYFYQKESSFLCQGGALNFVGALLAHQNQSAYEDILHKGGSEQTTVRNFYTIDTIPMVCNGNSVPVTVLHTLAHAIGDKEPGVIISGDYAGTIVSFYEGTAIAERMFNDEAIPQDQTKYRPYTPIFIMNEDGEESPEEKQMEVLYKAQYYALVDTVRKSIGRNDIWTTDLLFYLCRQIGIPIEVEKFTYTRE